MQISAEAPSFNTAAGEKEMQIYGELLNDTSLKRHQLTCKGALFTVLPTDRPTITLSRSEARPGDHLDISCTSGKSKPAGTLSLSLNGQPVSIHESLSYHNDHYHLSPSLHS